MQDGKNSEAKSNGTETVESHSEIAYSSGMRFVIPSLLLLGTAALATTLRVDLAPYTSQDIRTYTNGTNYPVGPTTLTTSGVSFDVAGNGVDSLNVIQDLQFSGGVVADITGLNFFGARAAYTLINTGFGTAGVNNGFLRFTGSLGATYDYQLVQGDNVRDHNNGLFNNTAVNLFDSFYYGNNAVRLDVQRILLPGAFASQTLDSVTFYGTANNYRDGWAFLAALTLSDIDPNAPVPEPGTYLLTGLALLSLARLRRR